MSVAELSERLATRASDVDPVRVLLTVLALPLFAVGWVVGNVVRAVFYVGAWLIAAVVEGYQAARRQGGR